MVFSLPVSFHFSAVPDADAEMLTQFSMPDSISVPSS
jgi:hypothetical protein